MTERTPWPERQFYAHGEITFVFEHDWRINEDVIAQAILSTDAEHPWHFYYSSSSDEKAKSLDALQVKFGYSLEGKTLSFSFRPELPVHSDQLQAYQEHVANLAERLEARGLSDVAKVSCKVWFVWLSETVVATVPV